MHLITHAAGRVLQGRSDFLSETLGECVATKRRASREKKLQFPRTPLKPPYNNTEGIFPPWDVIHHANVMTREIPSFTAEVPARRIKETVPSTYTEIIIVIRLFRAYEKDGGQR